MAFALSKQRLNVSKKSRSNLFNWRGQFTPEFVDYLLGHFAMAGSMVVDPFSGSGTVLSEALRRDIAATGLEINPAAYAMSKFFTLSMLSEKERTNIVTNVECALEKSFLSDTFRPVYVSHPDYRVAYKALLEIGGRLFPALGKNERVLLANCLFMSEKDRKSKLKVSLANSLSLLSNELFSLPLSKRPIEAYLDDARSIGDRFPDQCDLVLTSPPYINVFNYHQNFRAIVELMGFDVLAIADSEFGSNRKNRGNRFRTVVQYSLDIEQTAFSIWRALKSSGHLIMILGRESNVRGIPFMNGQIVSEILSGTEGFSELDFLERQFTNRFGQAIKEDILIFGKRDCLNLKSTARTVAKRHLEGVKKTVEGDVEIDLERALHDLPLIQASPQFRVRNILKNA